MVGHRRVPCSLSRVILHVPGHGPLGGSRRVVLGLRAARKHTKQITEGAEGDGHSSYRNIGIP